VAKANPNKDIDEVIKEMSDNGYLAVLFSAIKDEYTLDFLIKTCNIQE
jgi:hypothetical protein